MARDTHAEHPAHRASAGGSHYTVTYAGLGPITVEARNEEEAIAKAKEALGVVSSEKEPDVVKVPS